MNTLVNVVIFSALAFIVKTVINDVKFMLKDDGENFIE